MKILLADDDKNLREGLAALFSSEGFECLTAANGQEALSLVQKSPPDICIFDLMMPGLTGFEVCQELRAEGRKIPIVMLTARDAEGDHIKGLELGADDYITKPFSPMMLVARVKAIYRRSRYGTPSDIAPFCLSGITICKEKHTASYRSKTISLTKRELIFLELLGNRPQVVFSKDEILNACWGHDYIPNSRALDQFVSTLRRKLEKELKIGRVVYTVHGLGYRYQEQE